MPDENGVRTESATVRRVISPATKQGIARFFFVAIIVMILWDIVLGLPPGAGLIVLLGAITCFMLMNSALHDMHFLASAYLTQRLETLERMAGIEPSSDGAVMYTTSLEPIGTEESKQESIDEEPPVDEK